MLTTQQDLQRLPPITNTTGKWGVHKLRHTNATLLVNYGIYLQIVSEHLGDSDIKVTADTYAGVLDKWRIETANKIEQILTNQTPNKHPNAKIG